MREPLYIMPCLREFGIAPRGVLHVGAGRYEEAQEYADYGFKRVVWVDPITDIQPTLEGQSLVKVAMHNATLDGVDFYVASNGYSSSLFEFGTHATLYPSITMVEKIKVNTMTGVDLLKKHPEALKCNVLNIDTQGAEQNVLLGFWEKVVQFDCVYSEIYLDEVYEYCGKLSGMERIFADYDFIRIHTWIKPGEGWGNAFWVQRKLL